MATSSNKAAASNSKTINKSNGSKMNMNSTLINANKSDIDLELDMDDDDDDDDDDDEIEEGDGSNGHQSISSLSKSQIASTSVNHRVDMNDLGRRMRSFLKKNSFGFGCSW